jgi:hypothetical protein
MPEGAEPLTIETQNGVHCIWALVDPRAKKIERQFQIVGTGHEEVTDYHHYIGTVHEGKFVWHLFEIIYHPENNQ